LGAITLTRAPGPKWKGVMGKFNYLQFGNHR
jgi:hypothetical protein